MKKSLLAAALFSTSLLFGANSMQININNDTLELNSDFSLNNTLDVNSGGDFYYTLSYLTTKAKDNEENQSLTTMGMKVVNPYVDNYGFSLGIGIKTVYTNQYEKSFSTIPLSLFIKYELNEMFYFDLEGSYAPRVLSFMDAENYRDIKLKANYKILDGGYAYIGARDIEVTYKDQKDAIKYDTSMFFGYEFRF